MSPETELAITLARGPLIGTFLGLFLYGATCMQALYYFFTYYDDHRTLKLTVALLVTMETIHAAMSIWLMDNYLITEYGNVAALLSANWLSTATYILGLLIDFLVYLYFTWRIWSFTKSPWIVIVMTLISVSRTALSITASTLSVLKPSWRAFLNDYRMLLIIANILFIIGDTILASSMAYQLTKLKNWAHTIHLNRHRRMDHLLNRLLVFAVATGALTVFVDIVALILTLTLPQSLAFLSAILVQTRLYANSLLASLNIRKANSRAYENAASTTMNGVDMPGIPLRFAHPSDTEHELSESEEHGRQSLQAILPRKSTAESWHTAQNPTDSIQVTQV